MAVPINFADKPALKRVRGVGDARAQAIILERERQPFMSPESLALITVIPAATWKQLEKEGAISFTADPREWEKYCAKEQETPHSDVEPEAGSNLPANDTNESFSAEESNFEGNDIENEIRNGDEILDPHNQGAQGGLNPNQFDFKPQVSENTRGMQLYESELHPLDANAGNLREEQIQSQLTRLAERYRAEHQCQLDTVRAKHRHEMRTIIGAHQANLREQMGKSRFHIEDSDKQLQIARAELERGRANFDEETAKLNAEIIHLNENLMSVQQELRRAKTEKADATAQVFNLRQENQQLRRQLQSLQVTGGNNMTNQGYPGKSHEFQYESFAEESGGAMAGNDRGDQRYPNPMKSAVMDNWQGDHKREERMMNSRYDTQASRGRSRRRTLPPTPRDRQKEQHHRRRGSYHSPPPTHDSSEASEIHSEDSNDTSSDSSKSSEERRPRHRERHHKPTSRRRSRSPLPPKMQTFGGDTKDNWEAFILQFERTAKESSWRESKKLRKLYQCLTGVASLYANKMNVTGYKDLRSLLKRRFSKKEEASTARRMLRSIRQKEDESLEEFSQRVYFLADDAYPSESRKSLERNATEHFLLGCKDKVAALRAMEQKPSNIPKALKYIRQAQATSRAIFGSSKPEFRQRQATLIETEGCPTVRSVSHDQFEKRFSDMEKEVSELRNRLARRPEAAKLGTPPPTPPRSRSPSDNAQCFLCKGYGHLKINCPMRTPR